MKDRCGFLFVRYERRYSTELVSWEHAACPLSGIKKRPLLWGWLNTSSVVISIGATASVHYREVVRSWEGPLLEVPLYPYHVLCTACIGTNSVSLRVWDWGVEYGHCWPPHIAALALLALMALLICTLASFPSPAFSLSAVWGAAV